MNTSLFRFAAIVFTTACFAGCGRAHEQQTATVAGVVTIDGLPLPKGTVVATPVSGRAARGIIQSDGTFLLTTYHDGDGAIVGTHQVTVTATEPTGRRGKQSPDSVAFAESRSIIPLKYGDPSQSGFVFEVQAGQTNEWRIAITSK